MPRLRQVPVTAAAAVVGKHPPHHRQLEAVLTSPVNVKRHLSYFQIQLPK